MNEVVGIKEQSTNQISYVFSTESFEIGDMLIIDNGKGQYIFECVRELEPYNQYAHKLVEASSIRRATSDELLTYISNQNAKEPFKEVFNNMLKEMKINAILVDLEFSLDNQNLKYTYFSTDKLHFPSMIKHLLMNNPRRVKIEFYQVGEREYYAINGGIGVCGYELCCHTRSHNTPTITTNSLKAMGINIALKKTLTGTCGKYKCCVLFNPDEKQQLIDLLPDIDSQFIYKEQQVVVTAIDIEARTITALGEEIIIIDFDYFLKGTNVSN